MTNVARKISVREWAALPEDEPGELVDGVIVEEEEPSFLHELILTWLAQTLRNWGADRGVLVAGSGVKLALGSDRGRMADLVVYLPGGKRPPMRGPVDVPPSIAIEIVSPTPKDARRDRVEKVDDYASFGVKWCWLLDPELRTFEILELGAEGKYVHQLGVMGGVIDRVPGCDGLVLDIAALWRAIDDLLAEDK